MAVFDVSLWKYMGHGDRTAWDDFVGTHELVHHQFADAIRALGGAAYPLLPLAPAARGQWLIAPPEHLKYPWYPDDDWMSAHQAASDGEASSLLIASAPDMRSYDLQDPDQFASWLLIHAQEMQRIRTALGL